jgi:hypothetical protein
MAAFSKQISEPTPVAVSAAPTTADVAVATLPSAINAGTQIAQYNSLEAIDEAGKKLQNVNAQAQQGQKIISDLTTEFLDPNSKRSVDQIVGDFQKLQAGQIQGAITADEAKVRAVSTLRKAIANTPGLAPEFERAYQAMGFGATQGSTAGADILTSLTKQYADDLHEARSSNRTLQQLYSDREQAANADRADNVVSQMANAGTLALPYVIDTQAQLSQASVKDLQMKLQQDLKINGSAVNIPDYKIAAATIQGQLHANLDSQFAQATAKGQVFTQDQISAAHSRIDNSFNTFNTILDSADPLKILERANSLTKQSAQADLNKIWDTYGQAGIAAKLTSAENQSAMFLANMNLSSQIMRADNPNEVGAKLDDLARTDPTGEAAGLVTLMRSNPEVINYMIGRKAETGRLEPENSVTNQVTNQLTELMQQAWVNEDADLEDPAALDALTNALGSRWSTSISTGTLTNPKVVNASRKSATVRATIDNTLGTKTAAIENVLNEKQATQPNFTFTYNPNRKVPSYTVFGALSPNAADVTAPFSAVGSTSTFQGATIDTSGTEDYIKQLNEIYRYKQQVFGKQAADEWATGVNERFNPTVPEDTFTTENGETFRID